jgi:iron-sulfur cluster assembly accessory protein
MITVTDNAVNHLRALLAEHEAPANSGLRIFVENGGCSGLQYGMTVAPGQPDDEVTARDGVSVFIDPRSAEYLRGSEIDYHDDLTGTGFRIRNPNAKRTCGCGTSFEPAATEAGETAAAR